MTASTDGVAIDDDLEVVINGAPTGADLDLFNTLEFHALHRATERRSYHFALRHRRSQAALAAVHFHEGDAGQFESPLRGSFGGFAVVPGAGVTLAIMESFAAWVEAFLRDEAARRITLVLPPLSYHPDETSQWINVLFRAGYSIARHELSYGVDVDGPFEQHLDYGNRKQLRKCEREGVVSRRLDRDEYRSAYSVIEENRRKRGYAISMSWPALEAMCDRFPDNVTCFAAERHATMIAAAVCLRINARILYVFYWGEIAGVEALSPVTVLANRIYDYCMVEKIGFLDLGTATLDGVPNHGLIRYKRNLGCRASLKLTLAKAMS